MSTHHVRRRTGNTPAEIRSYHGAVPPLPDGFEAMDDAALATYKAQERAAVGEARAQDVLVIMRRLSASEWSALSAARQTNPDVDRFVSMALVAGTLTESSPDFAAARALLDSLGIIAASRWDALFSP